MLRILVAEDDLTSRILMQKLLSKYGEVNVAVNGQEAVEAFRMALKEGEPYNLMCLDIMMPEMDGHTALKNIREIEEKAGIGIGLGAKIIMTTALDDKDNVMKAFHTMCDAYLVKPIAVDKLVMHLKKFELID